MVLPPSHLRGGYLWTKPHMRKAWEGLDAARSHVWHWEARQFFSDFIIIFIIGRGGVSSQEITAGTRLVLCRVSVVFDRGVEMAWEQPVSYPPDPPIRSSLVTLHWEDELDRHDQSRQLGNGDDERWPPSMPLATLCRLKFQVCGEPFSPMCD